MSLYLFPSNSSTHCFPSTFSLHSHSPVVRLHLGSVPLLPATLHPHSLHPIVLKSQWLALHWLHFPPVTPGWHWPKRFRNKPHHTHPNYQSIYYSQFPSLLHCKLLDPRKRSRLILFILDSHFSVHTVAWSTSDVAFTGNAISIRSLVKILFALFTVGAISVSSTVEAVASMTGCFIESFVKVTSVTETVTVAS